MTAARWFTRATAAAGLVVLVGACSSSGKTASTTTTTAAGSSSTSAAATGAPIKVGLICDCSGPFGATIASTVDVAKAWANTVNASGGLSGHPVQLITEDDASNPGTSTSEAQTLINDHVDVLIDNSNFDAAWASTLSAAGIPAVGGNFSSEAFLTNADFYPSGQTNDSITQANVSVAKNAGSKNIGDLYCAEAPQCQQSVPLITAAGKQLGVPAVYSASVAATAPNYTAQCLAAQQAKVGALFIGDSSAIIARITTDCDKQGYDPTYVTEGTGFSMSLAAAPGAKDHLWSDYPIRPFWDTGSPAVQAMNTAMDKYFPGVRNQPVAWSEYAAQTWTAALLIRDAVKGSGLTATDTPSAAAIKKGLDSIQNDTLDGWSPPLSFTAGQIHKVDCWYVARVVGGTPQLENGGHLSCQNGASS